MVLHGNSQRARYGEGEEKGERRGKERGGWEGGEGREEREGEGRVGESKGRTQRKGER